MGKKKCREVLSRHHVLKKPIDRRAYLIIPRSNLNYIFRNAILSTRRQPGKKARNPTHDGPAGYHVALSKGIKMAG